MTSEQHKFRMLVEHLPDAFAYHRIITDDDGKPVDYVFIDVNPAFEKMTGLEKNQIIGKNVTEVLPSIKANEFDWIGTYGRVALSGESIRFEQYAESLSRWYEITAYSDEVGCFACVFRDITKSKQAEQKTREAHNRLLAVLNSLEAFVYVADMDTHEILYVNRFGQSVWGDTEGRKCWQVIQAGQTGPCEFCTNDQLLDQKGQPAGVIYWEFQNTRNGRWYYCSDSALRWIDGRMVRVEIALDITDRKRAEEKLADYILELEHLNRQLGEEMNKARQVHERTLPSNLPVIEPVSFAVHYQPAQKLGGDFYDLLLKDHKLIFYLSDVSGHGLDGAILSVFVKQTVKSYISFHSGEDVNPVSILHYLAEQFRQENYPEEYFICIFLGILNLDTLEFTYTGAGFQDTPLVKKNNGQRLKLSSRGLFITSYLPDSMLNLHEDRIVLEPGSTVFFNTDGLTEQGNNEAYYMERLPGTFYDNAHRSPHLIAQAVCEDFRQFTGGTLQGDDDITFLVLQVKPDEKM